MRTTMIFTTAVAVHLAVVAMVEPVLAQSVARKVTKPTMAVQLPIRPGYYAELPATCADAVRNATGVLVGTRSLDYIDMSVQIVRMSKSSNGDYALVGRAAGQGNSVTEPSKLSAITPNGFVWTRPGFGKFSYRYCSPKPPADLN